MSSELGQFEQKRELDELSTDLSGGPNYLIGQTLFCYDCHGGDAMDGSPSSFQNDPQDIAFGGAFDRGIEDGVIGYYELPDGREPGISVTAPSLTDVVNNPGDPIYVPGGHYIKTAMNTAGDEPGSSTNVQDNYNVRGPDGRLRYRISIGDKLPCEVCHDPHRGETGSLDQMFFRRDIYVGEGGQIITRSLSESGNYFNGKLEASGYTRNGAAGAGDGRKMCLYCHGSGDWNETENPGLSGGVAPLIVDWTAKTTIYGIKIRIGVDPTASTSFPPPNIIYHEKDYTDKPCQECHEHNNVGGSSCSGCHQYTPDLPGAHNKHQITQLVGGIEITCDICHGENAETGNHWGHTEGGNDVASANMTLLGMGNYSSKYPSAVMPSWFDSTWGPNGIANWTTLSNVTCQVRCHGNEPGSIDGDGSLSWYDTADSSSYNNVCFYCHNMVPSSFELFTDPGTIYQASNAAANYVGPISGFSRGGHGDTGINDPSWFEDSAPGTSVPLACVACHDESSQHFPIATNNPYRVSNAALSNNLSGASGIEGPLTNLCTQTGCHPKFLGSGDFGFLSSIKHPNDNWPITAPSPALMDVVSAEINNEGATSLSSPAFDPAGARSVAVDLHIDRYVDHWGYWKASTVCTPGNTDDDEPTLPLGDSLTMQVGDSYDNYNGFPVADHRLITCITCHNPHGTDLYVSGEGCGVASTLVNIPNNQMLRLRDQDDELCTACH